LLDNRDAMQVYTELLRRRLGYVPEWELSEPGAGSALGWIVARYVQAIIQRLNQAPEKNRLAFYDLLGLDLTPAQAARTPVVFQLSEQAADSRAPATAQLAAPPPPEQKDQVVFETERAIGIAAAKLTDVFSLWPGRDQYLDHSAAFLAGQAFQLFRKPLLQDTPHEIYLAHDTLLALAGSATVEVEFELTQPSGEPLSILWQYWDGKVWRGFRSVRPACSAVEAEHGVEAFWIRGHLSEPLLPEPAKALPRVEGVRLSTLIDQALKATLTPIIQADMPFKGDDRSTLTRIHGKASNEAGQGLQNVAVKITSPDDPNFPQEIVAIDNDGKYDFTEEVPAQQNYDVQVSFLNLEAMAKLRGLELNRDLEVDLGFNVVGLDPNQTYADAVKLDVSKPFYPFGQQPQPGAAFYFSQEEVFSKPGAQVQIYVAKTVSPQDAVTLGEGRTTLSHTIHWEYWNGRRWVTMFES
jgi:hypothetical protein